ncbi:hypothetical protein CH263_20240 [Rhodococcus sp. 06-1059B-a]|nr:DUF6461 domain-containing protein [Rhodococcus sp. 06-1059B-a]OZD60822.1 hypothetical protein CH263_20240 [Rhodococcus sp. 06-1059B-a]
MADYRDYDFLATSPFHWWINLNYCVTVVRDVSSRDFLSNIGAQVLPEPARGLEQVLAVDPPGIDPSDPLGQHKVGVADLKDGSVLVVEADFLGVVAAIVGPVAAQHDLVSVYGAEGRYQISVWTDGVLRVSTNPREPDSDSSWSGSDPGMLESVWSSVSPDEPEGERLSGIQVSQSLFAALETFTGVHLTEDDFLDTEFAVATVPRLIPAAGSDYMRRLREARWDARELT